MLADAGLRPEKRYGQHFLVDGNLMRLLVDAADLGPADTVLEVGPGVGNLTELLVERAGRVIAVEIDPAVAGIARERLAGAENLDLLVTDILADKHTISPKVLRLLGERSAAAGGPVKLVANLPYQAATPLVAELVLRQPPMERLVFTVQQEVAARLAACPATPDYGPVGVIVQALAQVEVLRRLSPGVFWPRPRVGSAMVRIRPQADRRRAIRNVEVFRRTVHGLFMHRRKRAARSLALADPAHGSPEAWAAALRTAGLDPQARGEAYTVDEMVRLANSLAK
ncbi:MAG: ribosomal RNA small subunit methyltransferase A [Planctomycetes bacterium]|nr:ribosomal RNA small subunit methyltransferase A [Planctomycetota bacterium]